LLGRTGDLSQSDLDQALATVSGARGVPSVTTFPKDLSRETAALAAAVLRGSAPDLASSECAELLGLPRVVARKYLEFFVDSGQATVSLRYGQTGRPQRRYAWGASQPN
jgi:response regulator of citrate/malate metabolism